jgi:hypothetical protein
MVSFLGRAAEAAFAGLMELLAFLGRHGLPA